MSLLKDYNFYFFLFYFLLLHALNYNNKTISITDDFGTTWDTYVDFQTLEETFTDSIMHFILETGK